MRASNGLQGHFYTDSSYLGYGGFVPNLGWVQGQFPQNWIDRARDKDGVHISFLELYPILAMVACFGDSFKNSVVYCHSDNTQAVAAVNKQSTAHKCSMVLVRKLVWILIDKNIDLRGQHIKGEDNILADKISRFASSPAELSAAGLPAAPCEVPFNVRPINICLPVT